MGVHHAVYIFSLLLRMFDIFHDKKISKKPAWNLVRDDSCTGLFPEMLSEITKGSTATCASVGDELNKLQFSSFMEPL